MCAPLGPALSYIKALIFDPVVIFSTWFHGALPPADAVPASFAWQWEKLQTLLDGNPMA